MGGSLSLSSREPQTMSWVRLSLPPRAVRNFGVFPHSHRVWFCSSWIPWGSHVQLWVRDAGTSFHRKTTFGGKRGNTPHFREVNNVRNHQSGVLGPPLHFDTIMFSLSYKQMKRQRVMSIIRFEKKVLRKKILNCC